MAACMAQPAGPFGILRLFELFEVSMQSFKYNYGYCIA